MHRLFATDLDGTILAKNTPFNKKDLKVLEVLGKEDIIRVVATGRTLHSALGVLPAAFPIDYLVFSSGAGVFCWKEKELLKTRHLGCEKTKQLVKLFNKFNIEYTLHHPIPENHMFFHPVGEDTHPDFERYIEFNHAHAEVIDNSVPDIDYTQTLAFIPDMNIFEQIAKHVKGAKVVRATSPIDGESIWMECFNNEVSKARGILDVCEKEDISPDNVAVVGNDYNDLDMLNRFKSAYVVSNAPELLKKQFTVLNDVFNAPLADWYSNYSIYK